MIPGDKITRAKYTDGPNESGFYTAGIDIECLHDIFGKPDMHSNAIEFHSKNQAIAEDRRDLVLRILQEHGLSR